MSEDGQLSQLLYIGLDHIYRGVLLSKLTYLSLLEKYIS